MSRYAVGVGVSSAATATEVAGLVADALAAAGAGPEDVGSVATVDARRDHPAIVALGWPVTAYAPSDLAGAVTGPEATLARPPVAEPAALLAAGPGATLVVRKRRSPHATAAVARAPLA